MTSVAPAAAASRASRAASPGPSAALTSTPTPRASASARNVSTSRAFAASPRPAFGLSISTALRSLIGSGRRGSPVIQAEGVSPRLPLTPRRSPLHEDQHGQHERRAPRGGEPQEL